MIRRRDGFTLIEVMVVIAVITVMISLLLPAVQQARETARRGQCVNNLHQFGLALHNYHDTHSVLPPGTITKFPSPKNGLAVLWGMNGFLDPNQATPETSWSLMLLPFLEQANLYTDFNKDVGVFGYVNMQPPYLATT